MNLGLEPSACLDALEFEDENEESISTALHATGDIDEQNRKNFCNLLA